MGSQKVKSVAGLIPMMIFSTLNCLSQYSNTNGVSLEPGGSTVWGDKLDHLGPSELDFAWSK